MPKLLPLASISLLVTLIVSLPSSGGASTVIGFWDPNNPTGNPILFANAFPLTDKYSDLGVVWTGSGAELGRSLAYSDGIIMGGPPIGERTRSQVNDTMTFLTPVYEVTFLALAKCKGAFEPSCVSEVDFQATAFDSSGQIVDTSGFTVLDPREVQDWTQISFAGPDISRIEYSATPGQYMEIDTLIFSQVPEPGTSLLVGLGLSGLSLRRRSSRSH